MAAYAQFGYNYPSASQLLTSGSQPTTQSSSGGIGGGPSAQSPSPLSPSGGSAATAVTSATASGVAQLGALSPGSLSQTSTNHGPPSMVGGGNGGALGSIPASSGGGGVGGQSTCCENGRPIMTDPVSGQTVCSCQYDSARLALSAGYAAATRIPNSAGVGVYGTPYPSTDQNPYPSIGVDSSAFYSPLSNPYGLKETSGTTGDMSAWTSAGLQPTTGYYPYDPTLAAYGYGAGYDLAARRKNATRESTATLKAWLNEHKKNPYPTKGEKIMLAIITKMTLTQVSTWFANARRRLKKENKMTWEPKNKTDDDDDAMLSDDDKEKDDLDGHHSGHPMDKQRDHKESVHHVKSEQHIKDEDDDDLGDDDRGKMDGGMAGHHLHHHHHLHHQQSSLNHHQQSMQHAQHQQQQQQLPGQQQHHHLSSSQQYPGGPGTGAQQQQYQSGLHPYHHPQAHPYYSGSASSLMYHPGVGGGIKEEQQHLGVTNSSISKNQTSSDCGVPLPASKPKIWSLADTAACKTPPHLHPLGLAGQDSLNSHLMHNHHHNHGHPHEHHHHGGPGHHHHNSHHQMQEHPHPDGAQQQGNNPWAAAAYAEQQYQQQQQGHMSHHPAAGNGSSSNSNSSGMGSNLAAMQGLADSLGASGGDGPSPVPNFQEAPHQMASPGNGLMLQYNSLAYGRAPSSGFLGGSRQHSISMDTDSSSYSSSNLHMNALPGPPITNQAANQHLNNRTNHSLPHLSAGTTGSHPAHQQQHTQHRSSSNGSSSSSSHTGTPPVGMGSFPELQTDTPPQTPPNMKLPSVAGNLLSSATANAGNGTCYSSNSAAAAVRSQALKGYVGGSNNNSNNMPSSPSSTGSAGMGFGGGGNNNGNGGTGNAMSASGGVDSDHDSFKTTSSSSSSSSSGSASPFFKSSAQVGNVAGFVSPV